MASFDLTILNYSETYFELDSEEAIYCDHCHLICCVYIKGYVETVDTKDQSNAIVYGMFVNTVDTGVSGSYTTLYTEYYEVWKLYSTLYKVASCPSQREGYCRSTVPSILWV